MDREMIKLVYNKYKIQFDYLWLEIYKGTENIVSYPYCSRIDNQLIDALFEVLYNHTVEESIYSINLIDKTRAYIDYDLIVIFDPMILMYTRSWELKLCLKCNSPENIKPEVIYKGRIFTDDIKKYLYVMGNKIDIDNRIKYEEAKFNLNGGGVYR